MRLVVGVLIFVATCVAAGSLAARQDASAPAAGDPPEWAYPVNPPRGPGARRPQDDGAPRRVPGSTVVLMRSQIRDLFNVPDWHPESHPPMPDVVAHGRRPDVWGCGFCHLPNGLGRPENSGVAGLPAAYIVQQMADFRSGARKSAVPSMRPPALMIEIAKAATDAEVRAAADYFASLRMTPWIRVVETETVPRTEIRGMLVPVEDGGTEPIGQRIIEVPEDLARTELRDSASGFVAYVPVGSVATGEALATNGEGKTIACAICHGPELRGLGPVPPIAGRSPSYLVRQLFDMQSGARDGAWADLMDEVVADLGLEDMVAIAAYAASLDP